MTLNQYVNKTKSILKTFNCIALHDREIGTKFFHTIEELKAYINETYIDNETMAVGQVYKYNELFVIYVD